MIPKVIHYVWFGKSKKPGIIKHCIKSWKKTMPDYEIKEWNEDNFDLDCNLYCRQAYDKKKYAFAADYARLWILYNCGGIYVETDCELFKPLDSFLNHEAFTCFESDTAIALCTVGAEKGNPIIKHMLDYYEDREFLDPKQPSGIDWTPNTVAMTKLLVKKGLVANNLYQKIEDLAVYPSIYFCSEGNGDNKYGTHYFTSTWLPKNSKEKIIGIEESVK
ncbi:MAG: glycosyl transferase [Clostridia bacterium]|nr:glycosyl transferase [Clostridia bacterium]